MADYLKMLDADGNVREVDPSYEDYHKEHRGYTDYQEPRVASDPGESDEKPKSRSSRKSDEKE